MTLVEIANNLRLRGKDLVEMVAAKDVREQERIILDMQDLLWDFEKMLDSVEQN